MEHLSMNAVEPIENCGSIKPVAVRRTERTEFVGQAYVIDFRPQPKLAIIDEMARWPKPSVFGTTAEGQITHVDW
jgi:hypothetical protein